MHISITVIMDYLQPWFNIIYVIKYFNYYQLFIITINHKNIFIVS